MKHKNGFLRGRFFVSIVVLLLFWTINIATAQTSVPAEDIAEKALAVTVYLEMKDKNGKTLGIGSGFFVKSNLIATNYHVIEGAASGTAKLVGKYTTYNIEGVTAIDKDNDLALLKVTAYGIRPLSLGDSNNIKTGSSVYVMGNPKGLEDAYLDCIVSPINLDEDAQKQIHIIGALIPPRSSGSPAFDNKWNVIGVFISTPSTNFKVSAENYDHIIPINVLKMLLKQSETVMPFSQEQQPISAETYYRWAYDKYKLGNYKESLKDFDMAIQLKPDYALAYYNRGVAKEMLREYFAAKIDYSSANNLEPDAATLWHSMAGFAITLGNYKGAISKYDMAIRLKPDYTEAYYNRGKAKFNLEKYFDAISDFDSAIRLKPDFAEAFDYRGLAKSNLGQHVFAIADFDTAIRLKPDYVKAYNNRGLAKFNLKQYASAVTDYDKAIQLNPNYAPAYYRRGGAKAELGQHFAAISDIDMFIRLRPNNADGYIMRGLVKSFKIGQHAAAVVDYDKAIQIGPNNAEAYYSRGFSKFQLDRTWEAKQDLQKALKLAEQASDARLKADIESLLQKIR